MDIMVGLTRHGLGSSAATVAKGGLVALVLGLLAVAGCDCDGGSSPATLPSLVLSAPVDGARLTIAEDADPSAAGFQLEVGADLQNIAAGSLVLSVFSDSDLARAQVVDTVSIDVEASGPVSSNELTLNEGGSFVLVAEFFDGAGEVKASDEASFALELVTEEACSEITFPVDGSTITGDDDRDAQAAGIQINAAINVCGAPIGTLVDLLINGEISRSDAYAGGTMTFSSVTLPPGAVTLMARVRPVAGGTFEDTVSVTVEDDAQSCDSISLSPVAAGSCDFLAANEDADTALAGFQTTFTVTTACSSAYLVVNGFRTEDMAVSDGSVDLVVTLQEGSNTVRAVAANDGDGVPTQDFIYFVDREVPSVEITAPADQSSYSFRDDLDADTDGIQFDLAATVSGNDGDATVEVGDNSSDVAVSAGTVDFVATASEDGTVAVTVSATDECANVGSDSIDITVDLNRPTLTITEPADQVSLGAADDLAADTQGLQTQFTVDCTDVDPGTTIEIACSTDANPTPLPRGSVELGGACPATVDVSFPFDRTERCVARTDNAISDEIEVTVQMVTPTISIQDPADGAVFAASPIEVFATTTNAEGLSADLTVGGAAVGSADVADESVFFPSVALTEGSNTITVALGDDVSAEATVVLDSVAPSISDISPSAVTEAEDCGSLDDGLQYDLTVTVADATATQVCVSVGTGAPRCEPVVAGAAVFSCLAVSPGTLALAVTATDLAGNTTRADHTLTVTVDVPTLTITSPADGSALSEATTDVTVATDLAAGTTVEIFLNESPTAAASGVVDASGDVTFSGVALVAEQENVILASGSDARGVGVSPPVSVQVSTVAPTVTFFTPADGATFNLTAADASGTAGFQTVVVVEAATVADGQPAHLAVDCAGHASAYDATIQNGRAVFTPTLADGSCSLDATVTNRAGLDGLAGITVTVDRHAPTVGFSGVSDGDFFTVMDDVNPATSAVDRNVQVTFAGLDAGDTVHLFGDLGDPDLSYVVADASETSHVFSQTPLPEGQYRLCAEISDAAGNIALECIEIQVDSSPLVLVIQTPTAGARLNALDDSDGATPELNYDVWVRTGELASGAVIPVRLCGSSSWVTDAAALANPCDTPGFFEIAAGDSTTGAINFSGTPFPDGSIQILAEAVLEAQVIASPTLSFQVDTVRPEVCSFVFTSDSLPPVDILNAAESEGPLPFDGSFDVTICGLDGEPRGVTLETSNPQGSAGSGVTDASGQVTISTLNMNEGLHNLTVAVTDAFGNDAEPFSKAITVHTTAPTIAFNNPTEGAILNMSADLDPATAGLQYQIDVSSDAVGQQVGLYAVVGTLDAGPGSGDDTLLATADVAGNDIAAMPVVTIADTTTMLAVWVTDFAGNVSHDTRNVTVDADAPVVTITQPASDVTVDLTDEVDSARAGYQYDMEVQSLTDIGAAVFIETVGGGVVSDPAVIGAGGAATVRVTIPSGTNVLVARITDAAGNTGSSSLVTVTVDIPGCGITFSDPTGSPLYMATDNDGDPSNGVATDWVAFVGDLACVGQDADILVGGVVVATAVVDGTGVATFTGIPLPNATVSTVVARVFDAGSHESTTPVTTVYVDLIAPTVSITAPAADPAVVGMAADSNGAAGFQTVISVLTSDAIGGTLDVSAAPGGPLLTDIAIVADAVVLPEITLPEGVQTVTVTVTDLAQTTSTDSVVFDVDITPPGALGLAATLLNTRRGEVQLDWTAPGDDGAAGGNVASYELRRSNNAIDSEATWASAEVLDNPPVVADAGNPETFTVASLAWATPTHDHYLAVRATDSHGNVSAVEADVMVTLVLQELGVTPAGADSSFASTMGFIGDVNNDGFDDLAGGTGWGVNQVFIVYGNAEPGVTPPVTQPLSAPRTANQFGVAFAPLGDVNGDSVDDFVVTDWAEGGSFTGAAYVYFGVDQGPVNDAPDVTILPPATAPSAYFLGVAASGGNNFLGYSTGDLNDIVVSSRPWPGPGDVFVIGGRTLAEWQANPTITLEFDQTLNEPNGVQWIQPDAGDVYFFGLTMAPLSDADGDGLDELAVGAPGNSGDDGTVYLFNGQDVSTTSIAQLTESVVVPPPNGTSGGQFGWDIRSADFTGDGSLDLVGAASGSDTLGVYAFDGGLTNTPDEAWQQPIAGQYGRSLAASDINDDTMEDLLAFNVEPGAGLFDVYFNDDTGIFGTPVTRDLRFDDAAIVDAQVIVGGFDFNGDGYEDLALGNGGEIRIYY